MVLRSKPRRLRLASLAAPLVLTAGCSSTQAPPRPPEARVEAPWRDADGKCWIMPAFNCPPPEEATCNPPPPAEVACPEDLSRLRSDDYRPPPPPSIHRDAEGTCWVDTSRDMDCPPNVACNPPPPMQVDCPSDPSQLTSDDYKPLPGPPLNVFKHPNGSCYEHVQIKCPPPEVATCNPPPPRVVPCPPGLDGDAE